MFGPSFGAPCRTGAFRLGRSSLAFAIEAIGLIGTIIGMGAIYLP
jgi:hypothetical protein